MDNWVEIIHLCVMEKFVDLNLLDAGSSEGLLKKLIEQGKIDVNIKRKDGATLLHRAIYSDNTEMAKYLLNLKKDNVYVVDINKKDGSGMTPLALASFFNRKDIVKILLDRDDVILKSEEDVKDPLSIACMENNEDIVKMILESGKINLCSRKSRINPRVSLLHCAYAKKNIDMMKELIKYGIDVNNLDSGGRTVAHYIVSQYSGKKGIQLLELLIESDKNCINVKDSNNDTILHYACKLGSFEIVKFLVSQKNLKVNTQDAHGFSALHFACLKNRLDMVKVFLERKDININIKEEQELTPLHIAANRCSGEVVSLLLQRGAYINVFDKRGLTPINYACFTNNLDTMRVLLKTDNIKLDKYSSKDLSMVFAICANGYTDLLEIMLDKIDMDLGFKNVSGNNLFWLACDEGRIDMVNMLLNRSELETNHKNSKDKKGISPLHRACCKKNVELVKLLLKQSDIDVNIKDNEGWTPLHYMTYANYTNIIKLLLEDPRVRVNERDSSGCTPIRYACDRNDVDLVNMLLKRGGDLTIRDNYGLSPIHMVFTRNNKEIMDTIKQAILKELVKICRNNDVINLDNLLNICRAVHFGLEKECLRIACDAGSEIVLKHLLKKGVSVNQRYEEQVTLMYYACLNDNVNIASILMDYDIDISDSILEKYVNNSKDIYISELILRYATFKFLDACKKENIEEAIKLLNYNLDINILAEGNESILDITNGNKDIGEALNKNLSKRLPVALDKRATDDVMLLMKLGVETEMSDKNGKTVLMHAIDSGYFLFAKKLIDSGVNINVCDLSGMNVLMYASKKGNVELVKLLLSKELDINATDKMNKTALMYALENRANYVAGILIKSGINVMAEDINEKSTLMYALENKLYGITRYLIERGISKYIDKNGRTLLMYAAKGSTRDIIEHLLEIGFNINYINENKESALLWAMRGKNRDAIEYLLEKGAWFSILDRKERKALKELTKLDNKTTIMIAVQEYDINKIEQYPKQKRMALVYAMAYGYNAVAKYIVDSSNINMTYNCYTLLTYTIMMGNDNMVDYLIKNGADINSKSINKITALMVACHLGYTKVVKKLIEAGANTELMDNNGMTAIWYAFLGGRNKQTIDYLLNHGVRIYRVNNNNMNMLMHASNYGLEYAVKELINRGFGVNNSNEEQKTALLYALENGHDRIARILIKNNANISIIKKRITAVFEISKIMKKDFSIEEVVKYIKGYNTEVFFDSLSKKNMSVLRKLVDKEMNDVDENGKTTLMYLCENGIECAKLFINNDIGINDVDNKGNTPLMYAMKGDNKNLIRSLICEGAHLDTADKEGKTVLMYAIELNQKTVLQYRSMNVDICDNNGDTALMYAVRVGDKDIVEELLLRCADTNIINKDGKTVLMAAIEAGKTKIAKLLINYSLTDVNKQNEKGEMAITYAVRGKYLSIAKELLTKGAVIPNDKDTIMYIKSLMKNDDKIQELIKSNVLSRKKQTHIPAVKCDRELSTHSLKR